jgi:DNA ligase-1
MIDFTKFKPMKPPSGTLNIDDVIYPKRGSIKYDGFRVVIMNGRTWLNSLREIDNLYTRKTLEFYSDILDKFDCELTVGDVTDPECFNNCQSAFSKVTGEPDFTLWVFDRVSEGSYSERFLKFQKLNDYPKFVKFVSQVNINSREELDFYQELVINDRHEGIMLRDSRSNYKFGRATFKSQEILRIKPMETDEAIVIGFEPAYENTNEKTVDNHGNSKRSSHKSGKVVKCTLGSLICTHPKFGEIKLSSFTAKYALVIWEHQDYYLGKLATFSYQAHGTTDKPRLPKFKGFRVEGDMS